MLSSEQEPYLPYKPYSYCVMDDVIVSIVISITELYGQLSGKKVVLLYYKSSESLKFGVWKQHMFTYQVCCLLAEQAQRVKY